MSCTQEMINNLNAMCRIGVKDEVLKWRECCSKKITQALRSEVGDKYLDIPMLDRMTRGIIGAIQYPEISLPEFPQELGGSGKLEGWQAEEYIKKFDDFFYNYRSTVDKATQDYLIKLIEGLKKIRLSDQVFRSLEKELARLESEIQNKQSNLDRYKRMIVTLEAI